MNLKMIFTFLVSLFVLVGCNSEPSVSHPDQVILDNWKNQKGTKAAIYLISDSTRQELLKLKSEVDQMKNNSGARFEYLEHFKANPISKVATFDYSVNSPISFNGKKAEWLVVVKTNDMAIHNDVKVYSTQNLPEGEDKIIADLKKPTLRKIRLSQMYPNSFESSMEKVDFNIYRALISEKM